MVGLPNEAVLWNEAVKRLQDEILKGIIVEISFLPVLTIAGEGIAENNNFSRNSNVFVR